MTEKQLMRIVLKGRAHRRNRERVHHVAKVRARARLNGSHA